MSENLGHQVDQPPEEVKLSTRMVERLLKISGDVAGQDCIVVDDMVDTGSTVRLALEVLQNHDCRYTGS